MATATVKQQTDGRTEDLAIQLDLGLRHLCALMDVCTHEGGESFRDQDEDAQSNYLSMCATLARQCQSLYWQINSPEVCAL